MSDEGKNPQPSNTCIHTRLLVPETVTTIIDELIDNAISNIYGNVGSVPVQQKLNGPKTGSVDIQTEHLTPNHVPDRKAPEPQRPKRPLSAKDPKELSGTESNSSDTNDQSVSGFHGDNASNLSSDINVSQSRDDIIKLSKKQSSKFLDLPVIESPDVSGALAPVQQKSVDETPPQNMSVSIAEKVDREGDSLSTSKRPVFKRAKRPAPLPPTKPPAAKPCNALEQPETRNPALIEHEESLDQASHTSLAVPLAERVTDEAESLEPLKTPVKRRAKRRAPQPPQKQKPQEVQPDSTKPEESKSPILQEDEAATPENETRELVQPTEAKQSSESKRGRPVRKSKILRFLFCCREQSKGDNSAVKLEDSELFESKKEKNKTKSKGSKIGKAIGKVLSCWCMGRSDKKGDIYKESEDSNQSILVEH